MEDEPVRACFFASGSGSLTQGAIESTRGTFHDPHPELTLGEIEKDGNPISVPYPVHLEGRVSVPLIIYNKRDAKVIDRANKLKVDAKGFFDYPKRTDFMKNGKMDENGLKTARIEWEAPLLDTLRDYGIQQIGLAGWNLAVYHPEILHEWKGKIFNAHPALLPAFAGTMDAYAEALWYGVTVGGGTIHLVTEDLDEGPIILQTPFAMPPYTGSDLSQLKDARTPDERKTYWASRLDTLVEHGKRYEWSAWNAVTFLVANDCLETFDGPTGEQLGLKGPKYENPRPHVRIDLHKTYDRIRTQKT